MLLAGAGWPRPSCTAHCTSEKCCIARITWLAELHISPMCVRTHHLVSNHAIWTKKTHLGCGNLQFHSVRATFVADWRNPVFLGKFSPAPTSAIMRNKPQITANRRKLKKCAFHFPSVERNWLRYHCNSFHFCEFVDRIARNPNAWEKIGLQHVVKAP